MHLKPVSLFKRGALILAAAAALLSAGCASNIVNMTADTLAENPSGIYTITARVQPDKTELIKGSLHVSIVIDGQIHPMTLSQLGDGIYEYDYHMPAGRTEATYYLLINYGAIRGKTGFPVEEYTELRTIKLANRYVYTLDAIRGPIGARIAIVGRGFTPQDVVYVGSTPARTMFESLNVISFAVPPVAAGQNYEISVNNGTTSQKVGTFRVDGLSLTVNPSEISLRTGGRATLNLSLIHISEPTRPY